MLYGVNAFEISDNQEDEARPVPRQNHRRNNVTAAKLASAGVLANDNDNSTCSLWLGRARAMAWVRKLPRI